MSHRIFQSTNQKLQGFLPYTLINLQGRNLCRLMVGILGETMTS